MDRRITRRDFVNGVSVAAAGALLLPNWGARDGAAGVRARTGARLLPTRLDRCDLQSIKGGEFGGTVTHPSEAFRVLVTGLDESGLPLTVIRE